MPAEISDWLSLALFATFFVAYLEVRKASKSGEAIQALAEVIDASEKTNTYLLLRAKGNERDRSTRAAFLISRVNKDLSVCLDAKGRFWRDPDTWNTTLRASKDISLDGVTADARRLMASHA